MQVETERQREERLTRRNYLRQLDDKLNASKPKTKKKREEAKVVEEKEKEEVVPIDEASNEDALFNEEE